MPVDALPTELRTLLDATSRLAAALQTPTYLVGGAVRDLLLGRAFVDVDLAVDGDAIALGRELATELPAALRVHEAFGTAVLETADGHHLDLASVRRESYASDAALPTVFPGSLNDDLLRRDFTVNSMAIALEDLGYPELVDPSGGRGDVAARVLRVHHERSFLDDPTRILRGVRLEARLGFGFEAQTEQWAREAATSGVFDLLTGDRLTGELALLFREESDLAVMWRRLADLGVLAALGFQEAPSTPELLASVRGSAQDWRARYDREYPISVAGALVRGALLEQPRANWAALLERLRVSPSAAEELDRLEGLAVLLENPELQPHRANRELERLSPEALLLLLARGEAECAARVHHHLDEQRRLRLQIDGDALIRRGFASGPEIGRALQGTRDARLDGRIGSGDELEFAIEIMRQGGER